MNKSPEQVIQDFLKNKHLLLLTENSTDKTAWKKIFHELGIPVVNIFNASTIEEAEDMLEEQTINIVFSSYTIDEIPVMDIVDLHTTKNPNRSEYLYFMVSERNSLAVAFCAAEHDIDALLIKPYNLAELKGQITQALMKKIHLSKDEKLFYEIKTDLTFGKYEEVLEKIQNFKTAKPNSAAPFYLEGLYLKLNNEPEKALEVWKEALNRDPLNHKCLTAIFDTHIQLKQFETAYPYAEVLCDKYPINPERIPNFIRVSLATKNYQNLIDFCEMILEVESNLGGIKRPVAAALAISAKNLAHDEEYYELVKHASIKAIELTNHKSQIFMTALENLVECGDRFTAQSIIDQIPSDEMGHQLLFIELKVLALDESNNSTTFQKAQTLYKLGYASSEFYQILIDSSIKMGKNKAYIEDLVFDACKKFPADEEICKKLV